MNGSHASPDSIQMAFRFGKRSGMPFISQLVRCVMLQVTNDIACTDVNRFIVEVIVSPQDGPAWNPIGMPSRSSSAYTGMYWFWCTPTPGRWLVTKKPSTSGWSW